MERRAIDNKQVKINRRFFPVLFAKNDVIDLNMVQFLSWLVAPLYRRTPNHNEYTRLMRDESVIKGLLGALWFLCLHLLSRKE
jgi:hypothetical protein